MNYYVIETENTDFIFYLVMAPFYVVICSEGINYVLVFGYFSSYQ